MLYTDTCFTAQALVRLMIDYNIRSNINKEDNVRQRFHDIISTFRLITTDIVGKFTSVSILILEMVVGYGNLYIIHDISNSEIFSILTNHSKTVNNLVLF